MTGSAPDPGAALVGLDGLEAPEPPRPAPGGRPLELTDEAREKIREEVQRARGREVCFLAEVTPERTVVRPRAVARGNRAAVLAVARDAPEGGILIHNHPSGHLAPSDADLAVAAQVFEQGLGTGITDNGATELYVVVEPPAPRVRVPLDPADLDSLLGPGGGLAALHPGYEDRPGQRAMMGEVADRYNDGGVALIEAGTGTGKSLAYLIPAARWALQNEERTVVSTNTINLQEQLVTKDLPVVAELVGQELTWAMVKGRGNYISIRRALLAQRGAPDLFDEDRSGELSALLEWIRETGDGSLTDLTFTPSEEVWDEVKSDPDACLRARCPHFQDCFYQRSRRRAASARLLVVNHHLLFTDVAVRRATQNWSQAAVLPAYRHVILDEAHNVEDAATSHLGAQVTRRGLFRLLARLDRRGKGLLTTLADTLADQEGRGVDHRTRIEEKVRPAVEEARAQLSLFLDLLEPLVRPAAGEGEAVRIGGGGEGTLPEPVEDEAIAERLHGLLGGLQGLARHVAELRARIEADEALAPEVEGRLLDLRGAERRLGAAEVALRLVLEPGDQESRLVRWLQLRGKGKRRNLVLAAAPIELGPVLREALFSKAETTVLTSATLTTRRRFDFLRERLGLDPAGIAELERPLDVRERMVSSPFDFEGQSLLVVPTDLPDAQGDPAGLDRETARVLLELAERTDGGILALFTSFRSLRGVADRLRGAGVRWPLFVQGEADRSRLLSGFAGDGRGLLLGTASFWEGVDVPGDPLRGLIIQRIPFRVPTEPVTAARVEALERRGGNAFYGYMLPLAALRLKQGFGRLIRSRSDRGAVVVLDDRIVRRRYGAYLRDSLPDSPLVKGPWDEVRRHVDRFYGSG